MKIFRILRNFLLVVITLVVVAELAMLVTGRQYLNKLLRHTVFEGRMGPSIQEYEIYSNRAVEATNPKDWPKHPKYGVVQITDSMKMAHAKYGSIGFGVFVKGQILYDHYWDGYDESSLTNSWSMAKSVISHLIGVAIKEGRIKSVNDKYSDYLPEFNTKDVTIKHLLTMSSGIAFDEAYSDPFSYPARSLYDSDLRKIHKDYLPVTEPGKIWDYQSGNTQLLAFLLEKVIDTSISAYASKNIWGSIGASHDALWSLDQEGGTERAFCCLHSNVKDFAKFGELYRNQCKINGAWVIDSTYYFDAIHPADLTHPDGRKATLYGYQWWLMDHQGHHIFYARGLNGQYIFVIPDLEAVVVRLGHHRDVKKLDDHPIDVFGYLEQAYYLIDQAN